MQSGSAGIVPPRCPAPLFAIYAVTHL